MIHVIAQGQRANQCTFERLDFSDFTADVINEQGFIRMNRDP
jgi:hypothetical protein